TIGLGRYSVSSCSRVPRPPQRITTFIARTLMKRIRRDKVKLAAAWGHASALDSRPIAGACPDAAQSPRPRGQYCTFFKGAGVRKVRTDPRPTFGLPTFDLISPARRLQ